MMSATKNRFPGKGTCLAIYSRAINSGAALSDVLAASFPWCAQWEAELNKLFAAYAAEKGAQNALDYDDLLLYWAHMVAEPALSREIGARFAPESFIEAKAPMATPTTSATCHQFLPVAAMWRAT